MVRVEPVDDELRRCLVSPATESAVSCVLTGEHDPGQREVSEVLAMPSDDDLAVRALP